MRNAGACFDGRASKYQEQIPRLIIRLITIHSTYILIITTENSGPETYVFGIYYLPKRPQPRLTRISAWLNPPWSDVESVYASSEQEGRDRLRVERMKRNEGKGFNLNG